MCLRPWFLFLVSVLVLVSGFSSLSTNSQSPRQQERGFGMNKKLLLAACPMLLALITQPTLARNKKPPYSKISVVNPLQYSTFARPLPPSDTARHALDRLSFGPRQGDIDEMQHIGLEKWVALQLHPENLPENPALEAKLEPLDTLRMSIHDTFIHYPQPRLVAAVARGTQPLPDDPELRIVVQHLVDRYLRRTAAKNGTPPAMPDDDSDLEAQIPLTEILSAHQIDVLKEGRPDQKKQVLAAIPENRMLDFAYALHAKERRQLLPLAPPALQRKLLLATSPQAVILEDLTGAKILRAVYSTHQLEEEMVDFWFNHFNVYFDKGGDRYMLPTYEREAIRPYALGKFHDLLLATAKSPAMLFYLDNAESVAADLGRRSMVNPKRAKRGLNENYGRELMELHTLGVNGGYSQKDVIEVARCFTGWTISTPRKGSTFFFNERVHDKGQKIVLGHVIPAGGGMDDGLKVLNILARSPQTAHHLSLQLAERFVADDPPPSLVNRMAETYMRNDGDIREVLRTMILSPEFFSQGAYRAKVKSPFEMIVSSVRAANASVDSPLVLSRQIAQLGEPLYRKIEPTGYSSANAEWVSSASLLTRMNFALALANNRVPGVHVDERLWEQLAQSDPLNVARSLLIANPDAQTTAAIQKAIGSEDVRDQIAQSARLRRPLLPSLVAGLVMGSPAFQRR
jgi:uncharacterized protein (DUF1800 family)